MRSEARTMDAWCLSHYGIDRWEKSWPLYPNDHGNGMSAMHTFILAVIFRFLPMNMWTVRIPVVIFSVIDWIFGIMIASELHNGDKKSKYLVGLVMTTGSVFILTSRMGLDCYLMLSGSTVLFIPPLIILAVPLMIEQLINLMNLPEMKLWIFTLPKMYGYRGGEIIPFSLDNFDRVISSFFVGKETGVTMISGYMPCYAISIPFLGLVCFPV